MKLKVPTDDGLDPNEVAHVKEFFKYYEPEVLSYDKHWRMVQNIAFYAEQANIPEHFIYNSALEILNDKEQTYVRDFSKQQDLGVSGILYADSKNYIDRMYAMCGVLIRNYRSCRYITVQQLIESIKDGHSPKEDLVCIPNFALPKDEGGNVASWELAHVLGWVLDARGRGQQAALFVEDKTDISRQYGNVILQHINNHFIEL